MKLTDLSPEETALVLKNRGHTPPPPADDDNEVPALGFSEAQMRVLICIDALRTVQELYVPPGCLLQTRLAQAQDLLLVLTGLAVPAPAEAEEEPPEDEAEAAAAPEQDKAYTVG
jgi:hypothetical protein